MRSSERPCILVVFPTALGWMAMLGSGSALRYLTFGHPSPKKARAAIPPHLARRAVPGQWNPALRARLQAYARGGHDDFRDVRVELVACGPFRRRVIEACRRIGFGRTCTYRDLAARAGSPRAARAVGNCMASNPVPLIVPCHRVVSADGSLGGYSGAGGAGMKHRLLDLEQATCLRGAVSPATRRLNTPTPPARTPPRGSHEARELI